MKQLAISVKEFGQMLQSCRPPSGWGKLLAVAHSGGADSTCLLYLLHRVISEQHTTPGSPEGLLSVSVDHSLQPGSAATAERCQQFSQSLRVPHVTLRIPWAKSPFPHLPEPGRPFESLARSARYRMLLTAMMKNNSTVIAMGHHADDHVETLLMRLARNDDTGAIPMGMRKCRRWGMGSYPHGLDWAGEAGMNRWIVRPLLGVSKDRILATCEMHGLNYINDPTNFQPSLTPRNYVRHFLSHQQPPSQGPVELTNLDGAIHRLDTIATTKTDLPKGSPLTEKLRAAAGYIEQLRNDIDEEVSRYLLEFIQPSPPSTLLLRTPVDALQSPLEIRRAIILRILRFVSPRPWGTPAAEASRQSSSLDLIGDRIWSSPPELMKRFTAGGEVIWTPVFLQEDGRIRLEAKDHTAVRAWLASRQPPIKRAGASSPCERDISALLVSDCTRVQILWDNRFLLHLLPHLLPSDILNSCRTPGSVKIIPHGRLLLPKISWTWQGHNGVLGGVGLDVRRKLIAQEASPDWVKFDWIRPLDPI